MNDRTLIPIVPPSLPLIGPEDPPPFQILNPDGRAPLILVCDHASNAIPPAMNNLGLSAKDLTHHIAWDIGAGEVTRQLSQRLDAPAVLAGYSRLLIDCNRPPGNPTSIPVASDNVFIPGNHRLDDHEAELRRKAFFQPYHEAITSTIARIWRHGKAPALVAVHSFTPALHDGHPRPWHVSILWNRDPRLAKPILQHLHAYPDLHVGDNVPYSGRDLGYTMETHAGAAGLPHMEFEIRQDQLMDAAGRERWAKLLGDVLEIVLEDRSLYAVAHY